jgi:DNA-binding MarR family transcriptional regulator
MQRPSRQGSHAETQTDLEAAAEGLRRLVLAAAQLRHRYSELVGVGETDLMALGNLATAGAMSPAELANRLGVTRSSVTALVDRLEQAGLVSRQNDPHDRRRLRLVVTADGDQVLRKTRARSLDALRIIDEEQLSAVARALAEVADALETDAARHGDQKRPRAG